MEELQSTRGRTEGDTRPTRVDWWLSTTITSTTTLLLVVCLLYSCNTRWREHSTPFLCCPFNESVLCRLLQYNKNSARPHPPLPQPVSQPSCAPPGAADKPHRVEDEGGRCRRIDTEEEDKTFCDYNLMRVARLLLVLLFVIFLFVVSCHYLVLPPLSLSGRWKSIVSYLFSSGEGGNGSGLRRFLEELIGGLLILG